MTRELVAAAEAWSMRDLCRLYAYAYRAGHEDTCEACYTHVVEADVETYHEDEVVEYLNDHEKRAHPPAAAERVKALEQRAESAEHDLGILTTVVRTGFPPPRSIPMRECAETAARIAVATAERIAVLEGLLREVKLFISWMPDPHARDLHERIRAALAARKEGA